MTNHAAQQPPVDDAQVSEAVNSALDQLHLDDLSDTSRDPKQSETGTAASTNSVFPPPPMMNMGYMHYPHMMHLPHSPGYFQAPGPSDPFVSDSQANMTSVDPTAIFSAQQQTANPAVSNANMSGNAGSTALDIGFTTNIDPLWSSSKQDFGPDYQFISRELPEASNASRRQTFPAVSGAEILTDGTAIRTQSISLEKTEGNAESGQKPRDSDPELSKQNATAVPYSAAAYPYGGPLVQPNPVLSGHTPPGSAPAYGIPSPFHAYGFSSPFQSFSPIPGTPLGGRSVNVPFQSAEHSEKEGPVPENANSPRSASSQPLAPWMYGNHPFGPMVPMHHQMMGPPGNNNNHMHPSHAHNNRHPMHSRRHKGSHNQKAYHRKGEDPAKYANAKLENYIGNILSLCKDQHGCRFLQRQLDIGGSDAADAIFEETKSYVVELMTDSFGNYLIQKLLERVNDSQRLELVRSSSQSFIYISLDPHGTRALQKLVECITTEEEASIIVESLRGSIVELSRDLNGNHVVQKCLQKLKPEDFEFIFEAATEACVKIATHRHGCCVLQRCLDHGNDEQFRRLCEQIITHVDALTTDPFGNYVVQYILTKQTERSESEYIDRVVSLLRPKIIELSLHKFGSNVVEKALRTPAASEVMINELLSHGNSTKIEQLLHDGYGNYVLQTALDAARENNRSLYQRLSDTLKPMLVGPIRNTPHGRRIMGILEVE
ncbi:LANO_0F07294g1_1 [Lachancea nothofagi CBS 11611]|uniref:LANO_0F07294g1_1 n=1 Tax=Lachancea nothofagi CBS 11611 TaxID=1266666 RepID=A0A1G4K8X7_9SACH|nr:LANO_0F07294g1_1 [Lachancea nothofagi CBS 11611]